MDTTKFSILIPARKGSKRIPNKNVVQINGRPLISYVLEQALKITPEVYVSTDCRDIAAVASQYGAKVIDRPPELATDISDVKHTIKHFLQKVKTDIIILMQATSPLVLEKHILEGLEKIQNKDSVISVCETREFFWSSAGRPINYELGKKPRTQDMDPYYRENGAFYITRSKDFLENFDLVSGAVDFVMMPETLSLDIDTQEDLDLLRRLVSANNG